MLSCVSQYSGRSERDRKYKTLVPGHKDFGLMEVIKPYMWLDIMNDKHTYPWLGIMWDKADLHVVEYSITYGGL